MSEPHSGRAYVVTGAGGGIGGATVRRLLSEGGCVLAADISGSRLNALRARTEGSVGRLETLKADVRSQADGARVIEAAVAAFGIVHGIANVAGGLPTVTEEMQEPLFSAISLEYLKDTLSLNLESTFIMCQGIAQHFARNGYGKIVNVASLAAFPNRAETGNVAYNAAKAGIVALTRTLSQILGPDGIRANTIVPGLILSERVAAAYVGGFVERHLSTVPLGRLATTEEAGGTIGFLLEARSDGISGEEIRISAGLR